jgi:AcrR family transcriptional regulator
MTHARSEERPQRATTPGAIAQRRVKTPKTERGARTQAKIVAAARETFEQMGYAKSRISDIAGAADVALGTFYRYFDDRDDVLGALLEKVFDDLYAAARAPYVGSGDPGAVLSTAIRGYMRVYMENSALLRVSMEAATTDPRFADLWFEVRSQFFGRVVVGIELAQEAKLARPQNPVILASVLSGMLEYGCWIWFSMGGERIDGGTVVTAEFDDLAEVMDNIWAAGLFGDHLATDNSPTDL